jgi:RNA polymerase sigma factor (sigma-70 family)
MHAASVPTTDHDQIFSNEILPHLERVCRAVARRYCAADPSGAEDIAAESALRAWRFRSRFKSGSSAAAWLTVITRNRAFEACKAAARAHRDALAVSTDPIESDRLLHYWRGNSVEDQAIARLDAAAELARISPELHPDRLAAIALSDLGYSEKEIAAAQGCAVGTVGQRVHRGHAQAREARGELGRGQARAGLIALCASRSA